MQAFAMETGALLEGRYRLLDRIGIASSTVYLASREGDPRLLVARLWRADRELTEHPRGKALLEHALEQLGAARRLQQTLFARVEAFGLLEDGTLYVISEHVEGTPLDAWADRTGIPPLPSVIDLGNRLCVALNAAHRNGLAHAALHPRNVIVLPQEGSGAVPRMNAKLIDFGVPSFMHKSPPSINAARFMAPEQLERSLKHVFERTEPTVRMNVYSCGALLYYMCTGGPHLFGQTLEELMVAHAAHKLVPPSRINPNVLPALDDIILKALEPQPRARFSSAAELANALISIRFERSSSGVRPRVEDEQLEKVDAHATLDPLASGFESFETETTQVLDATSFDTGFGDERPTAEMPRLDTLRPSDKGRASASVPPIESAPEAATLRPPPAPAAVAAPASLPVLPPLPAPIASHAPRAVAVRPPSVPPPPPPIAARPEPPPLPPMARETGAPARRPAPRVPPAVWIALSALFACAAIYAVTRNSDAPPAIEVMPLREPARRVPAQARSTGGTVAPPEILETSSPAPAPAPVPEAQTEAPALAEAQEPSASKSKRARTREGPVVLLRESDAPELVVQKAAEEPPVEAAPSAPPAQAAASSERAPSAEQPVQERKPATTVLPLPAPSPAPAPAPAPSKTIAPLPQSSAFRSYELSVKGSLASSQVKRGIERVEGAMRACYKEALAARPSTIGELTITVEIDERGRARDARAAGQAPATLRSCVAGAARRISVTAPDTGTVTATWKVSL
jgi:serine/threonine protein kinase